MWSHAGATTVAAAPVLLRWRAKLSSSCQGGLHQFWCFLQSFYANASTPEEPRQCHWLLKTFSCLCVRATGEAVDCCAVRSVAAKFGPIQLLVDGIAVPR